MVGASEVILDPVLRNGSYTWQSHRIKETWGHKLQLLY